MYRPVLSRQTGHAPQREKKLNTTARSFSQLPLSRLAPSPTPPSQFSSSVFFCYLHASLLPQERPASLCMPARLSVYLCLPLFTFFCFHSDLPTRTCLSLPWRRVYFQFCRELPPHPLRLLLGSLLSVSFLFFSLLSRPGNSFFFFYLSLTRNSRNKTHPAMLQPHPWGSSK